MNASIVGGGVFGCVVARALKEAGWKVAVYDDHRSEGASRTSAFLMKPSWFSGLGKAVHEPALLMLDDIYGLQTIKFRIGPVRTKAYRVDREAVLQDPKLNFVKAKVTKVFENGTLKLHGGQMIHSDLIVVAAGIWSEELVGVDGLYGKKGVSFEWEGQELDKNIIRPWAPYKQVVVFQIPGRTIVWGGDGSAIKPENWTKEREKDCLRRVAHSVGFPINGAEGPTMRTGIRPFVDDAKPCLVQKKSHRLWVVTGGGKNGTIAAAWAAKQIVEKVE